MLTQRKVIPRQNIIDAVHMYATGDFSLRRAAEENGITHTYLRHVIEGRVRKNMTAEITAIMDAKGAKYAVECPHCKGAGVLYHQLEG